MQHFHTSDQRKSLVYICHVYLIPMIPVLQLNTNWFVFKCNTGTWWTSSVHITLI